MYSIEVIPRENVTGNAVQRQIAQDLGLHVESVRTSNVYYLDGGREDVALAITLLHDPVAQRAALELQESDGVIAEVRYKPSVTDPVEQSVRKTVQDAGIAIEDVTIARRFFFSPDVSEESAGSICAQLLANSITQDVFIASRKLASPAPRKIRGVENDAVHEVQMLDADDAALERISRDCLLSLSLEEMRAIARHFRKEGRNPTDAELETLAQTWSEHCKHKTFTSDILYAENGREEQIHNLFKSTIVAATNEVAKSKDWLVSVFSDNAGIISYNDTHNVAFKVETHNHPSALDPYGGAGTGIGGVIRDVLGAGLGAKPIFSTDVFCVGEPGAQEVPEKILHPRRILNGVVAGVRDYGNRMGIPTINGAVIFDRDYLGAPLVYCGTAGLIPNGMEHKQARPGDCIVVLGGLTGRDGIHGATFSSAVLDSDSPVSAVQIGNAIEEKRMMDALLACRDEGLYTAVTDCGAGGFSSAVGEMGEELGCVVQLEKAPLKYAGLAPWEIWLSESQERMVIAVPPSNMARVEEICAREGTQVAVIGEFTDTKRLVVRYKEKMVADMDMHFVHKGLPRAVRKASWSAPVLAEPDIKEQDDYGATLKQLLAMPTIASKEWIVRQYDHEVQGLSVAKPLTGAHDDGPADASALSPDGEHSIIVANGINPGYGRIDSYAMSLAALDEALRNIVAAGGNPAHTAILDNFCWGAVSEEKLGTLVRAARACHDGAIAYGTPFISGKDSLHNEFVLGEKKIAIPDTLLISALSVAKVENAVTMDAKQAGDHVYVVGLTRDELGGGAYYALHGHVGKNVPKVDLQKAPQILQMLSSAIAQKLVRACHDCSEGGLAVAAAEMAFAGDRGMSLNLRSVRYQGEMREDKLLFSESQTRFVVEVEPRHAEAFEQVMQGEAVAVGRITDDAMFTVTGLGSSAIIKESIAALKAAWQEALAW